ncbi:hypothetical protein HMPREF9377_00133 [Enterococcus faecalis R712]|nr:hypothetical protein HMPREF9377_00133 [Enterococcus faecalis R712]EFE20840.1 hypothetical protein HMPREF9376_00157 [Enterococcus faecalis S613]EFQ08500.1 hypothetical protein HMPREF9492_03084 [Enterococcus faecalis DAPTO 512]EFQ66560.1 hypothetical protein HMPREF9493_02824 [Enterococcus faecalis DAPTO 516]
MFSLLTAANFINDLEIQSMGLVIGITTIIFRLLLKLPIIIGENVIEKVN